ncbi:MAG: lycopene cyclase family protein [Bacteroidia bacterium]|nr:lycopene cyclase family protein [Bacteroidia bacterium]
MKSTTTSYDYIIAGAGCAGLGLVWRMLSSELSDTRILILDPDPKEQNDRTWCFWSDEAPDLPCHPSHSWRQLQVATPSKTLTLPLSPYSYYHVKGQDYYQSIKALIAMHPNVEWRREKVEQISSDKEIATVTTHSGSSYTGSWVFSSLPQTPKPLGDEGLLQHFYGVFVKTEFPAFDSKTVDLMDFRVEQDGEIRFYYLLPFSETEALIEFTVFSKTPWNRASYEVFIDEYLENLTAGGAGGIVITDSEQGVIPMNTVKANEPLHARVLNIGLAGGAARPGTGYAFPFIQRNNAKIVASLIADGYPQAAPYHSSRHLFYDSLLLRVLSKEGHYGRSIFEQLFQKQPTGRVLRFLAEESTLWEDIRIMISLPWAPFLRALFAKYAGITLPAISMAKPPSPLLSPLPHAHRRS